MRLFKRNIPNNNKEVVRLLVRESLRRHRGRSVVLAGTAALSIAVLCAVFSIALGKIDAEYLQTVRGSGTAATTYLERGTMEQYEAIGELDYISDVGRMKNAGEAYAGGQYVSGLEALDVAAWEKLQMPAYTHIEGYFPREEGEVMLPVRALKSAGIKEPKPGMEIGVTVRREGQEDRDVTFTLCGWFTDYLNPAVFPPVGYVSEKELEGWGMSLDEPDLILIRQNNWVDGYDIEERLYEDIPTIDRAQQFIGGNTHAYSVMNDFVGGYKMAAFCGGLVLASVFFLIRNILEISIQREIRQIGLLDTLGMTQRQIRSLYFWQTAVMLGYGALAGSVGALLVVLVLVPRALGSLYLYNFGRAESLMVFRPGLFAAAIVFTALIMLAAAARAVFTASRLTPLEALHYLEISRDGGRTCRGFGKWRRAGKNVVISMAWQNLLRYRKRFFLTILSLFLGVTTALGSVVLSRGTDYTNSIMKKSDFSIGGHSLILTGDAAYYRDDYALISEEIKEKLLLVRGIDSESVRVVRGAYLALDTEDQAWEPLMDAAEPDEGVDEAKPKQRVRQEGEATQQEIQEGEQGQEKIEQPQAPDIATVQIVDESYIRTLEEYVARNNLDADMESLRDGTGTLLIHHHELSPSLQEDADSRIGSVGTFWRLPSRQETEDALYGEAADLKVCGYLDVKAKEFPKLKQTWFGPGIWYFLVSEEGFSQLGTDEKTFGIDFDVEAGMEPSAKSEIHQILQEGNRKNGQEVMYVNCKSDDLADAQSYIRTNRIIMGALSLILILMGLLNYLNVSVTGMFTRQKELAVMESVGMTGRQMKRMLTAEGGIYCGIIVALVLTAGSGIMRLLHLYMDSRIAYFRFCYPWDTMLVILAALSVTCMGAPLLVYRYMERQSLTLRIGYWEF